MTLSHSQDINRRPEDRSELELLREENVRLAEINDEVFNYLRDKENTLLEVIGTKSLRPEELDDRSLIEFDPIGIVAETFQHILENLQETNQQLHFAHDEIQTVFKTVGSAVLVLDTQGKVVTYNQKTQDLLLGGDIDILGKRCRDHVCRMNIGDERCTFESVMRNGREQHFSDWELEGRSFDVIGRPMFDESGKITHVVMAYHDVSARRDAQNALLQSLSETQDANAKIHGILSSAADGILVTDAANKVVLINRRAEELIGFSLEEQGSDTEIDTIPHDGLVELLHQASQRGQETFSEDLTFQSSGHLPCVCQARITVINSSENEFNGCITLLHDVTEQREIDRMKDEFVSTAAHELRTPLATIIGYADLLTMDNDFSSEQQAEFLQHILKKAERLGDIVSNLLDISRIESGEGLQLNLKPHRPDTLCEEVVKNFRLQTSDHTFVLDFPPSSVAEVNVDRYAMTQILENLISNAVKYSPEGGEIRISSRLENGMCLLSISDQGIGMTFDQVVRIYDKFYRADASNTAISGTGLGMTIVKHLVEAQAGKVNLKSSPDKGTTVTIALPLAPDPSVSTGH
jgi:PAS domain S-box-containing protein